MNTDRMNSIIMHLQMALDGVRADLAETQDEDITMQHDEKCIEVALSRYQKRLKNARELDLRNFNNEHPQEVTA